MSTAASRALTAAADATLGVYRLTRRKRAGLGGGRFRVEEYKKPEYEVTVEAPKEPVMLGEKIEATIKAKYYFGSPVTKAKVKYKVQRTDVGRDLVSPRPWDWLYGRATGGSPATMPGIRAGRTGAAGVRCPSGVPRSAAAAGTGGRAGSRDRGRRNREGGDRHAAGQGPARRQGPPLHDHRRGGGPVAADNRRHGRPCSWPASRSR